MSKKVVLFNPLSFDRYVKGNAASISKSIVPLSLLTIAGPLARAGYGVVIIDQKKSLDWEKELKFCLSNNPICVGITSMTGVQIIHALEVSRFIKQNSKTPVVWGGIHPTLLPEQTLEDEHIDIVVEGEGEDAFTELVIALEQNTSLSRIRGIWHKDGDKIIKNPERDFVDLDKQPMLPYDLVSTQKTIKDLYIFSSRGCPYKCAYCYNPYINKQKWRSLSSEEFLKRVIYLKDNYSAKLSHLDIIDDDFFVDIKRANSIINGFIKLRFNLRWSALTNINSIMAADDAFLKLMEESGALYLRIGVQSGSKRILELIKKDIAITEIISFNKRISKFRIIPSYSFIIGFPGETLTDMKETVDLFFRLSRDNQRVNININVYSPYIHTDLLPIALEHGYRLPKKLVDWGNAGFKHIDSPWLDDEKIKYIKILLFCSPFLNRERFLRPLRRNLLFHALAMLYGPLARLRIKRNCYWLPLEIELGRRAGFLG